MSLSMFLSILLPPWATTKLSPTQPYCCGDGYSCPQSPGNALVLRQRWSVGVVRDQRETSVVKADENQQKETVSTGLTERPAPPNQRAQHAHCNQQADPRPDTHGEVDGRMDTDESADLRPERHGGLDGWMETDESVSSRLQELLCRFTFWIINSGDLARTVCGFVFWKIDKCDLVRSNK